MNNLGFELTDDQQRLYANLRDDILRQNINSLITSINVIMDLALPQETVVNLRNSYNQRYNQIQNRPIPNFENVVYQAKRELIEEYINDINSILNSGEPELRRAPGGGLVGALSEKILNILVPPRLGNQVVGGKLRKTSNKKVSIRRRRSSKARKARKSRITRRR
jgi:hypothetical protein